jgi:putative oxidoreductase
MKTFKFILCLFFAVTFINAGVNKFFPYAPIPTMTDEQLRISAAFDEIGWLIPLVGIIEIIGGLLCIFPKTRALGFIIILPVMAGIFLHNVYRDPSKTGIIISIILVLINIWIIIDNRNKYKSLIS